MVYQLKSMFFNDTDWVNYESIQSDIFDHLLAILPEFELEIFQSLSGNLNFIKTNEKFISRLTYYSKMSIHKY